MKKLFTVVVMLLACVMTWGHPSVRLENSHTGWADEACGESLWTESLSGSMMAANMLCLEVTSPAEDSFWFAETQVHIEWSSIGAEYVDIFYSLDNGASWLLIEKSYPSGGDYNHYVWLVPDIDGLFHQARIMVRNIKYADHFGISSPFTLCSMPVIFREPEHWEVFVAGEDEVILVEFEKKFDFALNYSIRWGTTFQPVDLGSGTITQPGVYQHEIRLDENTYPGEYPMVIHFDLPEDNAQGIAGGPTIVIESASEQPRLAIVPWPHETIFYSGDTQGFYWQAFNVDRINLYYSLDDGGSWESLAQVYNYYEPNYNATVFFVPEVETVHPDSRLKIESADDPTVFAISEPFTISPVPVEIRQPNAQTVILEEEPLVVELYLWQDMNLELFLVESDGDAVFIESVEGTVGLNTFEYTGPGHQAGMYRILVIAEGIHHVYSDPFEVISDSEALFILEPKDGDVFVVGEDEVLSVLVQKNCEASMDYSIHLTGSFNTALVGSGSVSQPGVYQHDLVLTKGFFPGQYEFSILSQYGGGTVPPTITIINDNPSLAVRPEFGEMPIWYAGDEEVIRWKSIQVDQVNFFYSTDGQSWIPIEESGTSYGEYFNSTFWIVPELQDVSHEGQIKIESADDPEIFAVTEYFTLSPSPVKILSPNAESVFTEGDDLEVTVYSWHYGQIGFALLNPDGNLGPLGDLQTVIPGENTYRFSDPGLVAGYNKVRVVFEFYDVVSEPFLVVAAGKTFPVTFSIGMTGAEGFDPDRHQVFVTGSFSDWAVPGTSKAMELVLTDREQLIYSGTLDVAPGQCSFKYYSDAYGQGWQGAEWEGEPNRRVMVADETTLNDQWGAHQEVFFTLELLAEPSEGGGVSRGGDYNAGQQVALEASANPGYAFMGWKKADGQLVSELPAFDYQMPGANITLRAEFAKATGMEEVYTLQEVSLFPNPASGVVNIASGYLIEEIQISDVNGRVVLSKTISAHEAQFSAAALDPGIYLVRIHTGKGIQTRRMIVMPD